MLDLLTTIAFASVYFTFPLVLWVILARGGISPFRLGIESFLLISMFLTSYVGLLPLFLEVDPYRVSMGTRGDITLGIVMICSLWAISMLAAGMSVVRRAIPVSENIAVIQKISKGQVVAAAGMMLACFGVLTLYLSNVDAVALFSALAGDAAEAALERSAMTNDFPGKYHWYSAFMHQVLWCVSLVFFAALLGKPNRTTVVLFIVACLSMTFSTTMSAQKAPFVWYLLSLAFLFVVIKHRGRLRPALAIGLTLVAIMMMAAIYFVIYDETIFGAVLRVLSRVFTGQLTPAYSYLQYFPEQHEFLLGRSFPNPGGLLPYEPFRLTVEIMNWIAPKVSERGIVGSAPTVFWGEIYANFGFWGVAIVPFFVGLWVGAVSRLVGMIPPSPIAAGFSVWLAFHFSDLAFTGVSAFIVDVDLVVVTAAVLCISGVGLALDRFIFDKNSATRLERI